MRKGNCRWISINRNIQFINKYLMSGWRWGSLFNAGFKFALLLDAMGIGMESFRVLFTFDTIVLFEWFSMGSISQLFDSIRIWMYWHCCDWKIKCFQCRYFVRTADAFKAIWNGVQRYLHSIYATRQLNYSWRKWKTKKKRSAVRENKIWSGTKLRSRLLSLPHTNFHSLFVFID